MKNIYTDLALEEREKFNRDIQIEGVEKYQGEFELEFKEKEVEATALLLNV